jgi:hypothetical protein
MVSREVRMPIVSTFCSDLWLRRPVWTRRYSRGQTRSVVQSTSCAAPWAFSTDLLSCPPDLRPSRTADLAHPARRASDYRNNAPE